jgi:hypothetical protein
MSTRRVYWIALTRSKARVLRDALGITAVALEELGDD